MKNLSAYFFSNVSLNLWAWLNENLEIVPIIQIKVETNTFMVETVQNVKLIDFGEINR
jgi:dolichyl-phosphate-mannose--protein O-mannosyl transferase